MGQKGWAITTEIFVIWLIFSPLTSCETGTSRNLWRGADERVWSFDDSYDWLDWNDWYELEQPTARPLPLTPSAQQLEEKNEKSEDESPLLRPSEQPCPSKCRYRVHLYRYDKNGVLDMRWFSPQESEGGLIKKDKWDSSWEDAYKSVVAKIVYERGNNWNVVKTSDPFLFQQK